MVVVKSIELKNFMCHANLKVNFEKRLTLIAGLNGSGKSAIMIAIGLLFGQKTSQLERGRSYGCLIKTNCDEAVVRVVLNNKSAKFCKDFFGSEIIIEKTLKVTRPKNQETISNKHENNSDLSQMGTLDDLECSTNGAACIHAFEMNVNPDDHKIGENSSSITVRDPSTQNIQLTSQIGPKKNQPLKSSSTIKITTSSGRVWSRSLADLDKLRTSFYLQFDNPINFLTQDFSKKFLSASDPKTLYTLFLKGTELLDIKMLHEEANQKASLMKSKINDIIDEIKQLKRQIVEKEDLLSNAVQIKNLERQLHYLKLLSRWGGVHFGVFLDYKHRMDFVNGQIEQIISEKMKYETNTEILHREYLNIVENNRAFISANRQKISELKDKISNDNIQKREVQNDVNDIRTSISEGLSKLSDIYKLKKEHDTTDLESRMSQLQRSIEEKRKSAQDIEKQLEAQYNKCLERESEIKTVRDSITTLNARIEDQKRINSNRSTFFGIKMPNLVQIVRRTRFKDKVIGPMYEEISLMEHKWYKPLSIILNKFLAAFICFDDDDRRELIRIMQNIGFSCPIYKPTNKTQNILPYRENKQFKTALNVLRINNNVVVNQMIILTGVESIILVEDRAVAYKILDSNPKDVDMAFTIDGDTIKKIHGSMSDFAQSRKIDYYFENSSNKMQYLQSEVEKLKRSSFKNEHKEAYDTMKSELRRLEISRTADENVLGSLKEELVKIQNLKKLYFNEDEEFVKGELETNKAQLKDLQGQVDECEANINKYNAEIDELRQQILEKENLQREAYEKKLQNESKISNLRTRLMKVESDSARHQKSLDGLKAEIHAEVQKIKKSYDIYYEKYPEEKVKLKNSLDINNKDPDQANSLISHGNVQDNLISWQYKPNNENSRTAKPEITGSKSEEASKINNGVRTNRSNGPSDEISLSQAPKVENHLLSEGFSVSRPTPHAPVNEKSELDLKRIDVTSSMDSRNKLHQDPDSPNPDVEMVLDHKTDTLRKTFECDYIPSDIKPAPVIKREIDLIQRKIDARRHDISPSRLRKELKALNDEKDQKQNTITYYESKIKSTYEDTQKRIQKREEMKLAESERAGRDFKKLMLKRNYQGKLIFDHDNETLNMKVKIIGNKLGGDKNTLSGGERSFAGVCFILALWPSVCCHFKILDEFDVFMDSVNRRCALELIRECLQNNSNVKQVVLISPLDANLKSDDLCDIMVLEPPKRLS